MLIKRAWSHRSDLNIAGETVAVITRRYIAVLNPISGRGGLFLSTPRVFS